MKAASLMRVTAAGAVWCAAGLLLASCAATTTGPMKPALAGHKVGDVGSAKEWKEGEQEAGASESAGMNDVPAPVDTAQPPSAVQASSDVKPEKVGAREAFPFVRVDVAAKVVEFDAQVPAYAYVPKDGIVFLEVIACTHDTREHEAVLVTPARASDVHAALLMVGLVPGAPGGWEWKDKTLVPVLPKGDAVDVAFVLERDGRMVEEPATSWIYNTATGKTMAQEMHADEGFVFAGSGFIKNGGGEHYAADGAGTLVGLATFGTETIAWKRVFSPESGVDEPVWAVKRDAQPAAGTKVIVRMRKK